MPKLLLMVVVVFFYAAVFATWSYSLNNAAKTRQWGWFVVMLFFAPACIFYIFLAYKSRSTIWKEKLRTLARNRARDQERRDEIAELRREVAALKAERSATPLA